MVNLDELKQCEHSKMICDPNAYNNNNTIICFPLKSNQIKKESNTTAIRMENDTEKK